MLWTLGRRGIKGCIAVIAISAIALCSGGCGGGSPVGPGTPTPAPTPDIRDGASEGHVSAAVSPSAPAVGGAIHVEAAGFLPRDTTFSGQPIYLWPQTADYLSPLVYFPEVGLTLTRWSATGFTIGAGDLMNDPVALSVIQQAATEASAATGITISVSTSGECAWSVSPSAPEFQSSPTAAALTFLTLSGSRIVGCKTLFRARFYLTGESPAPHQNTALHELGHALGLGYSPNLSDVMNRGDGPRTNARAFSDAEHLTLKMMYRFRQPGNRLPDSDR